MRRASRWFARCVGLTLVLTGMLTGCEGVIDVQQVVIVDQFSPDGRVVRTQMFSNVRPNPEMLNDKKMTAKKFLAELMKEVCKDMKKTGKEDGYKLLKCGYSPLPDIFGKLISRSPTPRGQADGLIVLKTAGSEATEKVVCNNTSCEFSLNRSGLSLRRTTSTGEFLPVSCTYVVQAPFPIDKTNADVTFHQYNAAAWNCTTGEDRKPTVIDIEASSPKK